MISITFWRRGLWSLLSLCLMALLALGLIFLYLQSFLPDVETLKTVQLQVPLRIYSLDGQLIAEYGEKRRTPVTIADIPQPLINALLATEDQRFFEHPGVDIFGLGRAAIQLIRTGEKVQGGSTITMQVARNFFLNRKKTFGRKLNEILLAMKIDRTLSKEKILELYLNKIYLGNRAYGVAAAAHVYYGKTLQELTLAQQAMLAGLPKAPSKLNPLASPPLALKRRNHVLKRLLEEGYIEQPLYENATNEPISASYHGSKITVAAPYVAEMIRQSLSTHFGKDMYTKGYQVYTSIDGRLQKAANQALRNGLLNYSHRHGYRGPEKNLSVDEEEALQHWLVELKDHPDINNLKAAVITEVTPYTATALLTNGSLINISWDGLSWARPQLSNGQLGPPPQQTSDVVNVGDLVRIQQTKNKQWQLSQFPQVEGALVALQPQDGAIKALTGGFSFALSKFNRATQAERQPGSAFKPFIYTAALSKGYTLANIINDAPVVLDDPSQTNLWRPRNDTRHFYGPTRLRTALTRSRNLASIRLLDAIGLRYVVDFLGKLGFDGSRIPVSLSLALGTLNLTPLQLANGYAIFANGGFKVKPYLITHIMDSRGQVIFQAKPAIACPSCENQTTDQTPMVPDEQLAPRVISPQVSYLINLALKGVIQHGTGRQARSLKRSDIAGKTGTTNDQRDAWFVGYNGNLVATAWVGYDQPQSLYEYGSKAALPIWIDFMRTALKGTPELSMTEPPGLVTVRIDPKTGLLAASGQTHSIFETFRQQYAPQRSNIAIVGNEHQQAINSTEDDNEHIF